MEEWTADLDEDRWKTDYINSGKDECGRYMIRKNTIPNASGVLFRKSVYEQAGYADGTMRLSGDWMTWVKMLLISDIAFVAEPLNYFRKHDSSVRAATGGVILEERYCIADYIRTRADVPRSVVEEVREETANMWLQPVLEGTGTISLARHRQLVRSARAFDQRIVSRLAGKYFRHVRNASFERFRGMVRGFRNAPGSPVGRRE